MLTVPQFRFHAVVEHNCKRNRRNFLYHLKIIYFIFESTNFIAEYSPSLEDDTHLTVLKK